MNKIFQVIRTQWIKLFLICIVLMAGYVYFQGSTTEVPAVTALTIETVKKGDLNIVVSGSGQIQADAQVDLKPVAAGDAIVVTSVAVKNEQEVKKGQVIAVLDNQDAWRDIRRAELDLSQSEIALKQKADLFSKETRDDKRERQLAEASVAKSKIALEEAWDRLAKFTIRAPFDGIVTSLTVESGDTVSQTGALASVITKNMKAVITLNEVDAAKVRVGNTATLSFDALPNKQTKGTITKLDTIGIATQGVVSYGAEISFDEQIFGLKPGMSIMAEISVEEKRDVLLIPNTALTDENGKTYVRLAQGDFEEREGTTKEQSMNRDQKKEITVGSTDNVYSEVTSGLSEGDRVLVTDSMNTAGSQANRQNQQGSVFNLFRGGNR